MTESTVPPFSTAAALRFGWETTSKNLRVLLPVGGGGAFLAILSQAVNHPDPHPLLGLALQILQAGVAMAFIRVALILQDGGPVDLTRPAELLRGFLPYLLTSILFALIVVGGLVLLIVPGVVWMLQFGFATFVSVDRHVDPIGCLHASSRLTRGSKGRLLGFALAAIAVNLLGCLALGIGLLFTLPTTLLAAAHIYRRLQARSDARTQLPVAVPAVP